MHLRALVAATLLAGLFFVADSPSAHAQTDNTAKENEPAKQLIVQPGDSLARLATAHETTYMRLFDANTIIKDPDLIYPGDTLRVPKTDEVLESRSLPPEAPTPVTITPQKRPAAQTRSVQAAPVTSSVPANAGVWDRLATCESGGRWNVNTGNGYYGGLQFSLSSWQAVGGSGYPHQASKSEQIARAEALKARQGWGAWPACTAKLGIR